ncbi:putative leader peptide [Pseudonocardia sp. GCM10023141]
MDTTSWLAQWRCHGRATGAARRHIDLQRVSSALCRS